MANQFPFENTVMLKSSLDMNLICQPIITNFGINYFSYTKLFEDNTRIYLSNYSAWAQAYNQEYYKVGLTSLPFHNYSSGHYIWSGSESLAIFVIAKKNFGINNGLLIIDKHRDSCEIYIFMTTCQNFSIINFYANNQNLLKRFIFYFKDKAADIICAANSDRLILPKCYEVDCSIRNVLLQSKSVTSIDKFISETKVRRYFVGSNSDTYLTYKEALCASLTLHGRTAKQIARIINLSPRTVEIYLEIIKNKLNAISKSNLIDILIEDGFLLIDVLPSRHYSKKNT